MIGVEIDDLLEDLFGGVDAVDQFVEVGDAVEKVGILGDGFAGFVQHAGGFGGAALADVNFNQPFDDGAVAGFADADSLQAGGEFVEAAGAAAEADEGGDDIGVVVVVGEEAEEDGLGVTGVAVLFGEIGLDDAGGDGGRVGGQPTGQDLARWSTFSGAGSIGRGLPRLGRTGVDR